VGLNPLNIMSHKNCLMAPPHRGEGGKYKREHLTRRRQFPALIQTCFDLPVSTHSDYISDPYQHHLFEKVLKGQFPEVGQPLLRFIF